MERHNTAPVTLPAVGRRQRCHGDDAIQVCGAGDAMGANPSKSTVVSFERTTRPLPPAASLTALADCASVDHVPRNDDLGTFKLAEALEWKETHHGYHRAAREPRRR